ncbi:MAG TPA: ABC transporter substrate-binding protein [Burkholderiales bacterium]|nr:ABC transporter substrate-binding protein [Burkholderiales bacterium]
MKRRKFIAGAGAATAGAAAIIHAPAVIAQQKYRWRMPTTWPPALDVMQGSAQRLGKMVAELSGGRLTIEVFPAGQIVPPLGVFEACSKGTVEAFMGASYYWTKQDPAVQWFCSVPFGMNPAGMASWYYQGGGLKLWEETYAAFNLVPRPGMSTGPQMAGWFRKPINTLADYKGLKMRIPGLGGKVVERAGGTVVLLPGGQIYSALERGVIDATEWVGPHDDMQLGLHRAAPYYYYPGWHEPATTLEFAFNKKAYDSLPTDLKRMLDYAVMSISVLGLSEYEAKNAIALERLKGEFKGKVQLTPLPPAVMADLKKLAADVVREEADKSPMAKKVYASFTQFQTRLGGWREISEGAYHQSVAL